MPDAVVLAPELRDLAARLARRLRRDDPLAMRVKLSRGDFLLALLTGLLHGGRG